MISTRPWLLRLRHHLRNYAEIMKELSAKNGEVAFLNAQRNDRDVVRQNAAAHFRTAEAALHVEAEQGDAAI